MAEFDDQTFIGAVTEVPAFVSMQRSLVIGVSGKARAGKDTFFATYASRGFQKASFAAELKRRVRRDFGLTEEHTDGALKEVKMDRLNGHSPREVMIAYGNMFREFNPSYWCDTLFNHITANPGKYIITDVRYENEAECIKSLGGVLLRLERHPSRDGLIDAATKNSISETALDNYVGWDLKLVGEYNRDLEDLENFASVVDQYLNGR